MDFFISRRDMLKMTGTALASYALGSSDSPIRTAKAASPDDTIIFNDKAIPVLCTAEICVAGGGCAGVAAAVMSARNGASTILLEQGIALGGNQSLGLVNPMMPTFAADSETPLLKEIIQRLEAYGSGQLILDRYGLSNCIGFSAEDMAQVYDDMCLEAGVTVLYHTTLVEAMCSKDKIQCCIIQTLQGLMAIRAKTFIDATGDALLARLAGVPVEKGNPEANGLNQPMSFRFEVAGIDVEKLYQYVTVQLGDTFCSRQPPLYYEIGYAYGNTHSKLDPFFKNAVQTGGLTKEHCAHIQAYTVKGKPGVMSFNCPEIPNRYRSTNPLEYAQAVQLGRKMQRQLIEYFRQHMPGFADAYISREAALLGVRESWRIRGKLIMTGKDYYGQSRFPDAIARSAYYVDIHGEKNGTPLQKGQYYEISFRTLITNEVSNLAVAGRCASADFELNASMRIQPTCIATGEAAGIASAWAIAHSLPVNEVKWEALPASIRSYVAKAQKE